MISLSLDLIKNDVQFKASEKFPYGATTFLFDMK
jgi:hypothetical protein